MSGSASGEMRSQQYNEDTFILSLKTMMYTMRRPPKVRFPRFFLVKWYQCPHAGIDIEVYFKKVFLTSLVGFLLKFHWHDPVNQFMKVPGYIFDTSMKW